MNSIYCIIKPLIFVIAVTFLNIVFLAAIVWALFKTATLSLIQVLGRIFGEGGEAEALAKQHLAAVALAAAAHKERLVALSAWCFKFAPRETA